MYRERAVPGTGVVVWTRTVPAGQTVGRILPDGCMDIVWADGVLLVAGPDTVAQLDTTHPGARYAGVRFAPGLAPTMLGVPAAELRDQRVPLSALWPDGRVRAVGERVGDAGDPAEALASVALGLLRRSNAPDPVVTAIASLSRSGAPVAAIADRVGLSERQLHRRSLTAFGYGPKTLTRILRMTRAVDLARTGTPFATVAAATGYADQA
ncbi:MAG: helix-turn-helix domain-containing protein, partial [Streptosporangiales bacterium]|nr:helix-turn-helix domain-containing protein [Streptosporangiales bacterium]